MQILRMLIIVLVLFYFSNSSAQTNQEILELHFQAYNSADISELSKTFHPDAKEYIYPAKLRFSTKKEILDSWSNYIRTRKPRSQIEEQINYGRVILTKEVIYYMFEGKTKKTSVVGIYEFKDGLIHKLTFIE